MPAGSEAMWLRRLEMEAFLHAEADLLDEWRLNDWLALFTDDALYWVPANRYETNPATEVSIIYDDRARMAMRVARLAGGGVHSQEPRSRTRRLIGNVRVLEADLANQTSGDGALRVSSNFSLAEARRGRTTHYAGRYVHDLVPVRDGWKIRRKKVELLENDQALGNLTFIL